jgi:hypothetical protein
MRRIDISTSNSISHFSVVPVMGAAEDGSGVQARGM